MGDRGNIVVRDYDAVEAGQSLADVWLYTHWAGGGMKRILQRALARKARWYDPPYLARIIFCEMAKDDIDSETGFGISTSMCDNEHDVLLVESGKERVVLLGCDWADQNSPLPVDVSPGIVKVWTFDEFIAETFKDE